ICVKPRKLNVSGLPSPRADRRFAAKRPNSIGSRSEPMQRQAAELNQACLLPMQRQRELRQSLAHVRQEPHGLGLVLKANDDVLSVARDDDVSLGMALPPLVLPRIKDLVPLHSDFDRLTVP